MDDSNVPHPQFNSEKKGNSRNVSRTGLIIGVLFGIPLVVTLLLQGVMHERLRENAVPVVEIFGAELPQTFEVVLTQKTEEGIFARVIDRSLQIRLDLFIVEKGGVAKGSELLDILKREKALKEASGISPAITKMFLGEFNPLRAKLEETFDIQIGSSVRTVSRIISKDKETFYIGVIGGSERQFGFILLDPKKELTKESLTSTLATLAPLG